MKTVIKEWKEVNLRELAEVAYSSMHHAGLTLKVAQSIEDTENWFREQEFSEGTVAVLSYTNSQLVGWMILVRQDESSFTMNPWGMHPFVSPEHDRREVSSSLVKHAVEWAEGEEFSTIQFYAQHSWEKDDEVQESFKELYNLQGLAAKTVSVDMKRGLAESELSSIKCPKGYQLVETKRFDNDTLYSCYYDAFEDEGLTLFVQQSDDERRAYFDDLASMNLNPKTSLAIEREDQLIGFSFVIPYGDENQHLTCICVHPEFGSKGLGRCLLNAIEREVQKQGSKTMTLYTDHGIRAFDLYIKSGWEVTETYTQYVWQREDTTDI
ncbi:MAG: GNAT family N-acetyltransferase [Candidatus Thorarchaeota archaeon]